MILNDGLPPVIFAGHSSTPPRQTTPKVYFEAEQVETTRNHQFSAKSAETTANTTAMMVDDEMFDSSAIHDDTPHLHSDNVTQLRLALAHSKARERILQDSILTLKQGLNERDTVVHSKQRLLEAVELEHRNTKASFRELMALTLENPIASTTTTKEQEQPTPCTLPRRRTRSVPPSSTSSPLRDSKDLKAQLRQTQDLLESLRGTNGYAQQILHRNSELEERLFQLQTHGDDKARLLAQEADRAKMLRLEAQNSQGMLQRLLDQAREEIAGLHKALAETHERSKNTSICQNEFVKLKSQVDDLKYELSSAQGLNVRLQAEWDAERRKFTSEVEFLTSLSKNRNPEKLNELGQLGEKLAAYDEKLEQEQRRYETALNKLLEENSQLSSHNSQLKESLEIREMKISELEEAVSSKESLLRELNDKLYRITSELEAVERSAGDQLKMKSELDSANERLKNEIEFNRSKEEQISVLLENLKMSNGKYSELTERHEVLSKLLQKQQQEKEKIVSDSIRAAEVLYDKTDSYRVKFESAVESIGKLKLEMSEKEASLQPLLQQVELEKMKEIRMLKSSHANAMKELIKSNEETISQLTSKYEMETTEMRKQREARLDKLAAQYEQYIEENRSMCEKKLADVTKSKDDIIAKLKLTTQQQISQLETEFLDKIQNDRIANEREVATLNEKYRADLKALLNTKSAEIQALQKQVETHETNYVLLHKQFEDSQHKLTQIKRRQNASQEYARGGPTSDYSDDVKKLKNELTALQSAKDEEIQSLKSDLLSNSQSLERKLTLSNQTVESLKEEIRTLAKTSLDGRASLEETLSEYKSIKLSLENKLEAIMAENAKLTSQLEKQQASDESRKDEKKSSTEERVLIIQERYEHSVMTLNQLETRLERETDILKSQIDAKDEIIKSLSTSHQYVNTILERNTALESEIASLQTKIKEVMSQQQTEASQNGAEALSAKYESLKAELSAMTMELNNHKAQGKLLNEKLVSLTSQSKEEVATLTSRTVSLKSEIQNLQENIRVLESKNDPSASASRKETWDLINAELRSNRDEIARLTDIIDSMRAKYEEGFRLSVELSLMKARFDASQQMVESLKSKIESRDSLIEELAKRSDEESFDSGKTSESAKIQELTIEVDRWRDQVLTFEQERRAYQYRTEMEKQLASQTLEQMDRQLKHLLETNKRAEQLFARNVELEELLLRLTCEDDDEDDEPKPTDSVAADESHVIASSRRSILRQELEKEGDDLRERLQRQEAEKRSIESKLREIQQLHASEIETLNERIRLSAISTSGSSNDDLVKALMNRTSELQDEIQTLKLDKQELSDLFHSTTTTVGANGGGVDPVVLAELSLLRSRVESLAAEKSSLHKRLNSLMEGVKSSSAESVEVSKIRKQNLEMQHQISDLGRIIKEQREALNLIGAYLDTASGRNLALGKIASQLQINCGSLEDVVEQNIKLKNLLVDLRTISSNDEFEQSVENLKDRLIKVRTDILAHDNNNNNNNNRRILSKFSTTTTVDTPILSPSPSPSRLFNDNNNVLVAGSSSSASSSSPEAFVRKRPRVSKKVPASSEAAVVSLEE